MELAFDLNRCLRKYKINNRKFAEILNERSKSDDVTHAPGIATISAWRCGTRRIATKHHEGLRLWLGEMKKEEEGEEEEEEDEEEEEEQEKSTGDEVAEIVGGFLSEGGEEEEARNEQRKEAAHRCSKLPAGANQIKNTAFNTLLDSVGPASAIPSPWPKRQKRGFRGADELEQLQFYRRNPPHYFLLNITAAAVSNRKG